MPKIYDVVVIGAGPAGAFYSLLAKKAGLDVLLIDKNKVVSRKICGEYLCPLGVGLLQELGLSDSVLGKSEPLFGMNIYTAKGTEVLTEFPDNKVGVSVNRSVFDKNLLMLALDAGVEFMSDTQLMAIENSSNSWVAATTRGKWKGRYLVGADGRISKVSKLFDNDKPSEIKRVALHIYVDNSVKNQRFGEMHLFDDGSYIGLNPINETETNISLVLDASTLKKYDSPVDSLNTYIKKSESLSSRFKLLEANTKVATTFPIQHRTKSVCPAANVALVGDAAGFVDPLTGEGLFNSLVSAKLLAEVMSKDLQKNLLLEQSTFANYAKEYHRFLAQKNKINNVFQKLIRQPKLVEMIAHFLKKKKSRGDAFIGAIGNVHTPTEAFFKMVS